MGLNADMSLDVDAGLNASCLLFVGRTIAWLAGLIRIVVLN